MFILKQLRRKKNASQTDLALVIDVSLRTIQLYEKKEANIPIKNLTKIAQYFDITIAELYAMENNTAEPELTYDIQRKLVKVDNGVRVPYVNTFIVNVPFIGVAIQEKYMHEYENLKFIEALPYIDFINNTIDEGYYAAFEIKSNAMDNGLVNGFPDKAIAFGKLQTKKQLIESYTNNTCWLLVCNNSILCKEVVGYNKDLNTITCHSLNASPEFSDFELELDTIKQFFVIVKKQM